MIIETFSKLGSRLLLTGILVLAVSSAFAQVVPPSGTGALGPGREHSASRGVVEWTLL